GYSNTGDEVENYGKPAPNTPYTSVAPTPDSRFPIPDSRFPIPDSRFPIPQF
ncbi:MAG: hypothetical protein F6K20_36470, partial [Moorea sp. SIO2C4]|nr:hypothetical protein [Moorena sp. SIO2C4]